MVLPHDGVMTSGQDRKVQVGRLRHLRGDVHVLQGIEGISAPPDVIRGDNKNNLFIRKPFSKKYIGLKAIFITFYMLVVVFFIILF
jgi:hypothetical protein